MAVAVPSAFGIEGGHDGGCSISASGPPRSRRWRAGGVLSSGMLCASQAANFPEPPGRDAVELAVVRGAAILSLLLQRASPVRCPPMPGAKRPYRVAQSSSGSPIATGHQQSLSDAETRPRRRRHPRERTAMPVPPRRRHPRERTVGIRARPRARLPSSAARPRARQPSSEPDLGQAAVLEGDPYRPVGKGERYWRAVEDHRAG
jgi:hypothetical protein